MIVFLDHGLSRAYKYLPIENSYLKRFLTVISTGETGVSIFFVLSGFLITYLLITEYEANKKINLKHFYIRRVLRIWPLYFAVVVFSFTLYAVLNKLMATPETHAHILYYLTFLSNFDVIHAITYHPGSGAIAQQVTWSVSIEEQFYLFWPLIFVFLPYRFWLYAIVTLIATAITFRIVNYANHTVLYFHTFSVLLYLSMGGLFAYLSKTKQKFHSFFQASSTKTHLLGILVSFSLLFFKDTLFNFKYGEAISGLFISTSFAFFICAQALTNSNSFLNLGNLSFANRWGKYTYGIYLIHPIVLTILSSVVKWVLFPNENSKGIFLVAAIGFVLTLLISYISYTYFEMMFLKLKDKFSVIKSHT